MANSPTYFTRVLSLYGNRLLLMKTKLLLVVVFALFFAGTFTSVRASHFSGGEIRYHPEGTKYRVELMLYNICLPNSALFPTSVSIGLASTCGGAFSRILPLVSLDTVTDAFCASALPGCGGNYPVTLVATFSDTVSIAPCASWKIWWFTGSRNSQISNLMNPGSQNIYLEAFLNNLSAPNACPRLASPPFQPMAVGTANTLFLHATDLQGDSIAYEIIPARTNGSGAPPTPVAIPYAPGYSALQPFGGTGTSLNATTGMLQATPSNLGMHVVNVRVKDYRQGVLVGYTERDWIALTLNGGSPAPMPASGTQFQYTTCPGQSHTLSLSFLDPGDSVYVTATPDASVTWPITVTGGAGMGSAAVTLSWTTPSTLNVSTTPYFYIRIKARDAACPVRGIGWYDVLVHTAQCNTDSVWAGDADGNYVVDLYDPLAIAVAYGKTGPARAGASTAWAAQWCNNWSTQFLNGVNHKHADCNGDGTVDNADLAAVTANWGQTHQREDDGEQPKETGVPDLYFDLTGINAVPGTTVNIPIKLGTSGSSMNGLYGLAARVRAQNAGGTSNLAISYPASWLGNTSNSLRFTAGAGTGAVDWAYARTTGTAMSGDGELARVAVPIAANTPAGTPIILRFQNVRLIGPTGAELTGYNVVSDTLMVGTDARVSSVASAVRDAFVVPNPSDRHAGLQVNLDKAQTVHISVTDAVGRLVWEQPKIYISGGSAALSLSDVDARAGMYFVRVQPADGSAGKVVKWVRE